jgi:hypothetical protein
MDQQALKQTVACGFIHFTSVESKEEIKKLLYVIKGRRKSILSTWEFLTCSLNEHREKLRVTFKLLKLLTYSLWGWESMNFLISSEPLMTSVPSVFSRGSRRILHCLMIPKNSMQNNV